MVTLKRSGNDAFVFREGTEENKTVMKNTIRAEIRKGARVRIVLKEDQRSGTLTEGIVKDVLTNTPVHHHGIKVRLEDGQVGRVKEIV
jgi:uncharacterized repeat protein (TIGR03833 family)